MKVFSALLLFVPSSSFQNYHVTVFSALLLLFLQGVGEAGARLGPACSNMVDTVSALVTHLSVSSLVGHLTEKLAAPLAALFTAASKKTPAKLHTPAFSQKVRPELEVEAELTCDKWTDRMI